MNFHLASVVKRYMCHVTQVLPFWRSEETLTSGRLILKRIKELKNFGKKIIKKYIPVALIGYEIGNSELSATSLFGLAKYHSISNTRSWNDCRKLCIAITQFLIVFFSFLQGLINFKNYEHHQYANVDDLAV